MTGARQRAQEAGIAVRAGAALQQTDLLEALRASEERYHLMVEQVSEYAIFMLGVDGHIATWNAGARRIKGYEADEVIGRPLEIFYTQEDKEAHKPQRLLAAASRDGSVEDEGWRVRKDGTLFWASVVITALHDAQGRLTGFAKVTRDLTERRQREEAERLAHERKMEVERLREMNEFKSDFMAMSAHELNTPLTPLSTVVYLIEQAPLNGEQLKRNLELHRTNLDRLRRLVLDLSDASRLDEPGFRLDRRRVDVSALVSDTLQLFDRDAHAQGVQLRLQAGEIPTVRADPHRLSQVIMNLVSNAIKFTPRGGAVEVSLRGEGDRVLIEVRDEGIGIEPEFLPRLFEPFSRSARVLGRHPGNGLGLYVSRAIVDRHGGRLVAESEGPGHGSTFRVELPVGESRTTS